MSWQQFKQAWLVKFWAPVPAVIAAGILSTYYFGITGTFWAVTGEFTRWGGQILQLFGVHAEEWGYYKLIHLEGTPLTRIDGMMILGMFGGCFAAALWANNVKLRMPRSRIRIMQAVMGGIIAGFGARMAMGCNLAAFFTGIPQFSLHAWFFALATAIGSWFGARFTLLPIFRIPVNMQKVSAASPLTQKPDQARRRFRLGMLVFIGMIGWALLTAMNQPKLGLAMLFGVGFGLPDRARANLLHLRLPRSVDHRAHPYGKGDHLRDGRQRNRYFQLRTTGRGSQNHVGGPECGHRRAVVWFWYRAGRRV